MAELVFIVEDDTKIAALISDFLKAAGFDTRLFPDARGVLDGVLSEEPNAIILDIMLPAGDGQSLVRSIREISILPIMMVSARREEEDKINALEGGADDYITKPFSGKELVARVKAQIRRAQGLRPGAKGRAISVDKALLQIFWKGTALDLSNSEYRILAALARRPGYVYSRDMLLDELGERSEESTDRAIDSHIKNIRKKIAAIDPKAAPIGSVYGSGYRFDVNGA